MKERPIAFSGPMVQTILEGRKTMTRRIVKPQPPMENCFSGWTPPFAVAGHDYHCPYGVPGDRLWVKETYQHFGNTSTGDRPIMASVKYRADEAVLQMGQWKSFEEAPIQKWWNTGKSPWQSSLFMPRWASRITLDITNVRVERLQEITEEDAQKEGMAWDDSVYDFSKLWDSIYGKGSWDLNPWVWCLSFRRLP